MRFCIRVRILLYVWIHQPFLSVNFNFYFLIFGTKVSAYSAWVNVCCLSLPIKSGGGGPDRLNELDFFICDFQIFVGCISSN